MATASKTRAARVCASTLVGLAAFTTTMGSAEAAPNFSDAGSFAVGVEDITGYESRTLKYDNQDHVALKLSRNRVAIAITGGNIRIGLHYFVIPHLSLGVFVGFESSAASNSYATRNGSETTDLPTDNRVLLAPRVGYALMFTPKVGIWLRGGIGYERDKYRFENSPNEYARDSLWLLSADAFFVWSPVPHFGLVVGPAADISFIGSHYERHPPNGSWSNSANMHRLAFTTGLFGYF